MHALQEFINFILHLDQQLIHWVSLYGTWTYSLLFLVIFCETGLVVLPFLPGDSLLFATGALAAHCPGIFNINFLFLLLTASSILGNSLNYYIGKWVGPKIFRAHSNLFLNKKHLDHAHGFFEKYGGKTIIIARFIPILRTVAPFVAGIGKMNSLFFFFYNTLGAILWVGSLLYVSYWFGNIAFVKDHFSTVVICIIIISLLPAIIAYVKQKIQKAPLSS